MSKANSIQIAGDHYQSKLQHWDWVAINNMNYYVANATKYVTRHHKKNGRDDLMKAQHYLVKYLELLEQGAVIITSYNFPVLRKPITAAEYSQFNHLDSTQCHILSLIMAEDGDKSIQENVSRALAHLKRYTVATYGTGDISQGDQQ